MDGIIIGVIDTEKLSEMGIDLSQLGEEVSAEELSALGIDINQLAGLTYPSGSEDDEELPEPTPVVKGLGWEAHCTRNGANKSYRQVQTDTQVLVRYGARGESGETLLKEFDTREEADAYVMSQKYAKERAGFKVLFRGVLSLDEPDPKDLDEAEEMFVDQWSHVIDPAFVEQSAPGEPRHWMLIQSLARTARFDPLSTAFLANLRSRAHAEDFDTDRLLAQVPDLKTFMNLEVPGFGKITTPITNYGSAEVSIVDIGLVNGTETQEEINRVLSLYYPKIPNPGKLFATVRRAVSP